MASHVVSVTEFKAKCLALMDEIATGGGTITVTKRGKPVAKVSPVTQKRRTSKGLWKGKIDIPDELLMADTPHLWDAEREAEALKL